MIWKTGLRKLVGASVPMPPCTRRALAAVAVTLPLLLIGASAMGYGDTTQVVTMNNQTDRVIAYQFTNKHDTKRWPAWNRHWEVDPHQSLTHRLSCYDGQRICYGAWVRDQPDLYWGIGLEHNEQCEDCCFVCGRVGAYTVDLHE